MPVGRAVSAVTAAVGDQAGYWPSHSRLQWLAKNAVVGECRGKRGGISVIYYWVVARGKILMLFVYPKSERDDLTPMQLRALKRIMEEEYP
jgi:hypothetical protein